MKKQVYEIDADGLLTEIHLAVFDSDGNPVEELPTGYVTEVPPQGLYRAKWTGTEWIEDMTQGEIDAINNVPQPKTEIELLKEENEVLKQRATQNSADLQGFMDYYFSLNPE